MTMRARDKWVTSIRPFVSKGLEGTTVSVNPALDEPRPEEPG
jgi:hypothetical protein